MANFILPQRATDQIDVQQFGAKADFRTVGPISIGATSTAVSSGAVSFLLSDIGKVICIPGAGSAGGMLVTTITAFIDSSHVTVGTPSVGAAGPETCSMGTDNGPTISAALTHANVTGGEYIGEALAMLFQSNVHVPAGAYLVATPIGAPGATRLFGHDAVLIAGTPTLDFMSLQYTQTVEGISFSGGRTAITIANGNVGENVYIRKCQFDGQQVYAIGSDAFSQSTGIFIEDCIFSDQLISTGAVMAFLSGDAINCINCSLVSDRDYFFTLSGCVMTIWGLYAAPAGGGAWVRCDTGSIRMYHCRLGGEAGGKVAVEWHSPPQTTVGGGSAYVPTCLTIEDCEIYNSSYLIKFYNLPGICRVRGNSGDNAQLYFDPSIPPNTRQMISQSLIADFHGNYPISFANPISDPQAATMYTTVLPSDEVQRASYATPADIQLLIPAAAHHTEMGTAWGLDGQATNLNGTVGSDIYGEELVAYFANTPSSLMNYGVPYVRALNGLIPGPYTMFCEVVVANGIASITLSAAGKSSPFTLPSGRHIIPIKFWHSYSNLQNPAWVSSAHHNIGDIIVYSDPTFGPASVWRATTSGNSGTTATVFAGGSFGTSVVDNQVIWEWLEDLSIGFTIQSIGTATIAPGALRVFAGHHNTPQGWRTEVLSPALPTAGIFRSGDIVNNTLPAPSGNIGWVCTADGAAVSGAWTTNHTYTYGQFVSNGGVAYMCMQGGTSLSTGSGPTGAAGILNIVDNTVVWNAVSNSIATFKTFGAISS